MIADPIGALASLLVIVALAGPGLLLSRHVGVFDQAVLALGLHLIVALSLYASVGLWAPDAVAYDEAGDIISRIWTQGYSHPPAMTAGKEGYPTLLAILYTAFGHHPFLGIAVNVSLAPLLVSIVATTARRTDLPVAASAWLAAALPPKVLWGSMGLREALSWVLLALVTLGLASMTARQNPVVSDWVLLALGLIGLVVIRGTMAVIVAAAVALAIIPISKHKTLPILIGGGLTIVAGPVILAQADRIAGGYGINEINTVRGALSREAGSSSFEVESYSGNLGVLTSLPQLLARALLGPFPWEWPAVGPVFVIDGIIWLAAVALLVVGLRGLDPARTLAHLLPAFSILVVLALTSGNYGTMQRLRIQALVVVLPLVARGWVTLRDRRAQRRAGGDARPAGGTARGARSATTDPRPASTPAAERHAAASPRRSALRGRHRASPLAGPRGASPP